MSYRPVDITVISQRAFSVLELMVTVSLMTALTVTTAPGFAKLLVKNEIDLKTTELHATLQAARNHAISRQLVVTVCAAASAEMAQCNPKRQRNTAWRHGWIVFADVDRDNNLSKADDILHIMQHDGDPVVVFNQQGRLRFFPDGSARSAGFYVCNPTVSAEGYVRLLYTGRSRVSRSLSAKQQAICRRNA